MKSRMKARRSGVAEPDRCSHSFSWLVEALGTRTCAAYQVGPNQSIQRSAQHIPSCHELRNGVASSGCLPMRRLVMHVRDWNGK